MIRRLLIVGTVFLSLGCSVAVAQDNFQQNQVQPPLGGVKIDLSVGDTTFLDRLLHASLLDNPFTHLMNRPFADAIDSTDDLDSTNDSLIYDLRVGNMFNKHRKNHHTFLITEPPYDRFVPDREAFSMIDFNRVYGFFLGLTTPGYVNFGRHDELGIKFGIGYGFAEHKGQSMLGGEYRIPLGSLSDSTKPADRWRWLPTLAVGAEYHNLTTTEDAWRTSRLENAFTAFFAREDFRDYFKIDGWHAHLDLRPDHESQIGVEYRSDIYYDQPQRVYIGRWGGNKFMPPNPQTLTGISTGRINSWVITAGEERVITDDQLVSNIFGDKVTLEMLKGRAYLIQAEFGTNNDTLMRISPLTSGTTYARYLLDARDFNPIVRGISIDTRLRLECETGNIPLQKLSFLGGPSSLPAYKDKIFVGNRMLLINTEFRLSLDELSSFFDQSDVSILILNDFGYIDQVDAGAGFFEGFNKMKFTTFAYNVGAGLGHPSGIQLGVAWRTDVKETARFFFRFQRAF